ncbi:hypothetical protein MDOR_31770 [Mycolicibacterium doricum]|uniref:TetR family transcriptional regulator n=1 Tax=Mycolicibacterium doricum TaxID=126673 RepID=A0A7I7VZM3_9MYCO|nr:hypothetical protein MDOR_31770 [Mycolicibacterium doricum]
MVPTLDRRHIAGRGVPAGLTERYFYESFADRDEFVRAAYDDVCTRAGAAAGPVHRVPRRPTERHP